ncbi:hypothetical protein HNQ93_003390 [Hymenobacter luteus]|uniref:DUF3575 domain-containing protein n=2 Tax=Hymenobacter TaxID=89966 RepID=A0A7W9WDL8_9BACT|nr:MULTISPECIES: hypothetical protein [Hymenobacter]MBB4602625.1 hypothetical protein [Hymenobacter latericoloratus]MBB6060516.1 hypothetical protein [Hymenobacter luteus]
MRAYLRLKNSLLFVAAGSLTGCSVYLPLQTSAPLLHDKGEAEVVGSAYLSGRLEGSVAYSPLQHVLVRAAGGLRPDNRDSTYSRSRQWEAGAGGYYYIKEQWLIGGLLGYGYGQGERRYQKTRLTAAFIIPYPTAGSTVAYHSRFHKLFGEAYIAHDAGWTTFGAACRLSQVAFASLTNHGVPVPLRRMTRLEPMLFMRFGGPGRLPWLQGQVATSVSVSPEGRSRSLNPEIRDNKEGRLFTTLGLVIYPHLFREYAGRSR